MTTFLILIVVALLAIALWQLTKIFDLTQVGSRVNDTQVADDNDNKVNGYLMFAFLVFIYITTIYCVWNYGHFPLLSDSASEHGPLVDNLMIISLVLIFIVQTITQALLHYFAFKYRGREGQKALYFADNNKLEVIWSSIPAVVLAGLILYGLYAWNNIMFVDKEQEQDAIIIELYAKQFGWEARYAGTDNVLGKANVRYIEGVNNLGVDLSDPNAQDDFASTELHLPKGKRVIFKMRSQDVLHSAYMPHFRAQMNCVPGMVTTFSFIPTLTTTEMRERPAIVEKVAAACHVDPSKLTIIVTPTSSLAGAVQVVARVLEVAMHKAHALHFPLENIIDGSGCAPICPPHPNFVKAMGRTNDAILFAGQVHLFVKGSDEAAEKLAKELPYILTD